MLIAPKRLKVRSSILACMLQGESPVMTTEKNFEKWAWSGSRDHVIFWTLNASSSKMTKDTNLKLGTHAPRESPDRMPEKLFSKAGVAIVT